MSDDTPTHRDAGAYIRTIELDDANATALFRAVFESSPDGLIVVDIDGIVRAASPTFAEMFGISRDAATGAQVDDFVPARDRADHARHRRDFAEAPTRRPMGTGLRLLAQHADGETFPVEVSLSPLTVGDEHLTLAAVRDVSERQAARSSLALAEERERIARDIHDMVIQRVFAAGMSLQAVMSMAESPVVRERLAAVTDDLDDTIRELRSAIFRLGPIDVERSLEARVRSVVDERSHFLGCTPHLEIEGELEGISEHIADQLLATLTESLSNVARHANATDVRVDVVHRDDGIALTVADDGTGMVGAPKPRGGLSNMMWRAAELGGRCSVEPNHPTGTRLVWQVPT